MRSNSRSRSGVIIATISPKPPGQHQRPHTKSEGLVIGVDRAPHEMWITVGVDRCFLTIPPTKPLPIIQARHPLPPPEAFPSDSRFPHPPRRLPLVC
jgi:hypothetical protein